ncbi:hypothetical protein ACC848_44425, partial [Rhizobium johnstonii]
MSQPATVDLPRRDLVLNRPIWLAPSVLFMTLFFVLPLLHNFWRSVSEERAENDALFYYIQLFTEPYYQEVLFQ